MAEYSPHDTPEMALISSAILLRASHILPQIGIIPRGLHDVALQLAWRTSEISPRRRPGVPHGQWSGLPGPDESDHPCGDETAGGSILAG